MKLKGSYPAMTGILLTLLHVVPACRAAEGGGLSLRDAVSMALRRGPALEEARAGKAIAREMEREARSGLYPRLELVTTATRGNNPVYVFGSLLEQEEFTADRFAIDKLNDPEPVNNVRSTANLLVPIFDSLQADVGAARAALALEKADQGREAAEQRIRFEVLKAYYGAVLAEERETVTRDSVRTAEADVERVGNMVQAGMVVRSDLLAAEVQLAEFRQADLEARADTTVARTALNTLLGLLRGDRTPLLDRLPERRFDIPDDEEAVAAALANRPELAEAAIDVRSADEGVRGAKGGYLPRVEGLGVYGLSGDTPSPDSTDWMIGVRVSFPLFDMGRWHRVGEARATRTMVEAGRKGLVDRVSVEAAASAGRLASLSERLTVASGAVGRAAEALRIVRDRYQVGLTTITEVLRAQNALLRARLGELTARHGVLVGYAEYLRATGALKSVEDL